MANNNILDKLLEDKKKTQVSSDNATTQKKNTNTNSVEGGYGTHTLKVVNLRYKIYTIITIVIMRICWAQFLQPQIQEFEGLKTTVADASVRIEGMTKKLGRYQQDLAYVSRIEKSEADIRSCINFKQNCDGLSEEIKANKEVIKAFLQIGNLYDSKMLIDEKSLLMNLDAFMTKQRNVDGNPTTENNGTIKELLIGDPQQITQQLYQVPVETVVVFPNSDDLMSFIINIEDRIIADVNTELFKSTPVLYRIQELAYDIVKYEEEQEVQLNMIAYYYEQKESPIDEWKL